MHLLVYDFETILNKTRIKSKTFTETIPDQEHQFLFDDTLINEVIAEAVAVDNSWEVWTIVIITVNSCIIGLVATVCFVWYRLKFRKITPRVKEHKTDGPSDNIELFSRVESHGDQPVNILA